MTVSPPSSGRVLWLLTRVAVRQHWNRLMTQMLRRGGKRGEPEKETRRTGTARKRRGMGAWVVLFAALFLVSAVNLAHLMVDRLEEHVAAEPAPALALARLVGVLLGILFAALYFQKLGTGNRELYQAGWTTEWLFTFPISARGIFLSRLLESALVYPTAWLTVLPLLSVVYWKPLGWWCVPLALAGTLFTTGCLAGVHVLTEVAARKRLSLGRIRNFQATSTVLGLVLLYVVMYPALVETPPRWLLAAAHAPTFLFWCTPALPALLATAAVPAALVGATMLALLAVTLAGSLAACSRLVRSGLVSSSGTLQGRRGRRGGGPPALRSPWLRGITRKEVLLLLRDRSLLVQTLVVPAVILGFQFAINPTLLEVASAEPRRAAAFAFGVAAYVLLFTGVTVLNNEKQALWMLYSFPQHLAGIMQRKARLWAGLGIVYALTVMWVFLRRLPEPTSENLMVSGLLLLGTVIYAYIACGLGILHADPLATESRRRMSLGASYLYLFLASLYGWAIYGASAPLARLVIPILCGLSAYAIWQQVRDHLPYLLDPVSRPPPTISLSDGFLAILAFFVLQIGVRGVLVWSLDLEPTEFLGPVATTAFATAGALVSLGYWSHLRRSGVPDLARTLGLHLGPRVLRSASMGVALGLLAGAAGMTYRVALERSAGLRDLFGLEEVPAGLAFQQIGAGWMLALALVAAPLFEEFLFRGIAYHGLRRSMGPWLSALGTAALFALVHPPAAMPAVFLMGLACAVGVQRTGTLLTPILTHAVYNLGALGVEVWLT